MARATAKMSLCIVTAVDGKPWSIRALLTQYLTDLKKAGSFANLIA